MTCQYQDLGSVSDWLNQISHAARPIRSIAQIWVVTRHRYEISALISQTSFCYETSGGVAQCCLLSQAGRQPNQNPITLINDDITLGMRVKKWVKESEKLNTIK